MADDELPPVVTRLTADITGLETGLAKGDALITAFRDKLEGGLGGGRGAGEQLGKDLAAGIEDAIPDAGNAGEQLGIELAKRNRERLKQDLPDSVEKPLEDSGRKGGEQGGKAAGEGFSAAASPLMIGAFTAAATIGPAAILAGTATAVIAAGALVTKGNAQLADSYQRLGSAASDMITTATEPLVPQLEAAVGVLHNGLNAIGPELQSVFAAVAPDVVPITEGLVGLVSNTLPGMASGLRAIVPFTHDIANDFGKIGSGLGAFFQGLGSGAAGGTSGFNALTDILKELLGDLGSVTGALANGLGPALQDTADVVDPLAHSLTALIGAIPPDVIRRSAEAFAILFGTFKIASLTPLIADGTTFLGLLKSWMTVEPAVTAETAALGAEVEGLGAKVMAAAGPLGILAGATTGLYFAIKNDNGAVQGMLDKAEAQVNAARAQKKVLDDTSRAVTAQADSFDALSGMLTGATLKTQENARQSAAATLAALGFADGESALATQLNITLQAFTNDSTEAGAYKTALDALYGKYQSYSDAQAAFTKDLDNAGKGLKAGKDGFDVNTTAGAANYELMSRLATANENRAEALLKETGSQQQANKELQNGALAIDAMAKKAKFTQAQIDALNIALYGTKNIGDISVPISADTQDVYTQVDKVINWIGAQTAYVQVQTTGGAPGGRAYTYDDGGFVDAPSGQPVAATVHGREYVLSEAMLAGRQAVDPGVLAALRSGMPGVGAQAPSAFAPGGGEPSITVIAPIYLDGQLVGRGVTKGTRSESQNFVRRNGKTGFVGVMK